MTTDIEDTPEAQWEHCHAVQDGDVLVEEATGAMWEIELNDDGSVVATDEYGDTERWEATELSAALRDKIMHRHRDGKSWELAG